MQLSMEEADMIRAGKLAACQHEHRPLNISGYARCRPYQVVPEISPSAGHFGIMIAGARRPR
jgi:hypothetical protein